LVAALCFGRPSLATPLSFTFDPSGAVPPLTGATVTANAMSYDSYVHSVVQPAGNFVSERVAVVNGFSLNGLAVLAPGFRSSYGLYFDFIDTGVSAPPSPLTFTSSSFRLMADPGYLNGAPSSTFGGFGFANTGATGVADDITLATGSMVVGTSSFDPVTGVRRTHFVETFVPAPNEEGFFLAPAFSTPVFIQFDNTVPRGGLVATPGPDGTVIQTINSAYGTAQFVPEPASFALAAVGLTGLWSVRRRRPPATKDVERTRQAVG
jgi:MYXO-CTERM domain-containing protein